MPDVAHNSSRPRAVVIGTTQTASELWARLVTGEHGVEPVGVVAARPEDQQADRPGVPLLGGLDVLAKLAAKGRVDLAIVSLPAAMATLAERIAGLLDDAGIEARWVSTLHDAIAGRATGARRLSVDPARLIGRTPRAVDNELIDAVIRGKRVLITGAGGSIGSELTRIAARHEPAELVLMDRSDNALFEIDRELAASTPGVSRRAVLHDVVDEEDTRRRLADLKPQVIFHAAAHKHVPLMEEHPAAAISNNLFGTRSVADAAVACGAERFVLISTDKAVHPTSVMGATKRMAELYIRSLAGRSATRFSLVRFGNVLGSACSVVPIWERQLAAGGPITVTDARMTRYFMTIPEAAGLVVQAAGLEPESETGAEEAGVFVLDMGEPLRILDLAQRFLELRGLRPRVDGAVEGTTGGAMPSFESLDPSFGQTGVRIVMTGVRPGEKLHEVLAYDAEALEPTAVDGVRAWRGSSVDREAVARMIGQLDPLRRRATSTREVIEAIRQHVERHAEKPMPGGGGLTVATPGLEVPSARAA